MAKKKFYAVAQGTKTGIFTTWAEAERQVKGFAGARFKGFFTRQEADDWLVTGKDLKTTARPKKKTHAASLKVSKTKPLEGEIVVYTDGGAINNPGPGGWAAVALDADQRDEMYGGFELTTNNRMELLACIMALEKLSESTKKIFLHSDSSYVVNGIEKGWARKWRNNNWKKSDGNSALNIDLWKRLLVATEKLSVTFVWVKGHAGNELNEWCDKMAVKFARAESSVKDVGYLESL